MPGSSDGDQHGSSDPRDEQVCRRTARNVERLAVGEPGRHERQPRARGRIRTRSSAPPAALLWSTGQGQHDGQRRGRCTASSRARTRDTYAAAPRRARRPASPWMREVALQPRHDPDEGQPEHDRDDAEHLGDHLGVAEHHRPQPAEQRPAQHEHQGEPEHEQQGASAPAAPGGGSALMLACRTG